MRLLLKKCLWLHKKSYHCFNVTAPMRIIVRTNNQIDMGVFLTTRSQMWFINAIQNIVTLIVWASNVDSLTVLCLFNISFALIITHRSFWLWCWWWLKLNVQILECFVVPMKLIYQQKKFSRCYLILGFLCFKRHKFEDKQLHKLNPISAQKCVCCFINWTKTETKVTEQIWFNNHAKDEKKLNGFKIKCVSFWLCQRSTSANLTKNISIDVCLFLLSLTVYLDYKRKRTHQYWSIWRNIL